MSYKDIHPMMWRFLPLADPLVDIVLSRDLDSVVNQRELAAVQEWLQSGALFHVMRDHPFHQTEILGQLYHHKEGKRGRKECVIYINIKRVKSRTKTTENMCEHCLIVIKGLQVNKTTTTIYCLKKYSSMNVVKVLTYTLRSLNYFCLRIIITLL